MGIKDRAIPRVTMLGLLSWFIPLLASFVLFPLKKPNAPLFATLTYPVVVATAEGLLLGRLVRSNAAQMQ
jgi:hypothetical protein